MGYLKLLGIDKTNMNVMYWLLIQMKAYLISKYACIIHAFKDCFCFKLNNENEKSMMIYTTYLYSFLLTITAVICWSIKIRIVARRANTGARKTSTHQGLDSRCSGKSRAWVTNQLRFSQVGLNSLGKGRTQF